MKKEIRTLAALLIASAAFVACSSSDDIAENNQQSVENPTAPKVYTLTVKASKGGDAALARAMAEARGEATTRAVELASDGMTLNAKWKAGDKVKVINWSTGENVGELMAQTAGESTTLSGTLTGGISIGNILHLQFNPSVDLSQPQAGTLDNISQNMDSALGILTVKSIDASGNITPEEATTEFENTFTIVRFTLVDKASPTTRLKPTALTITVSDTPTNLVYTLDELTDATYTANAYTKSGVAVSGDGVLYACILPTTAQDITLTATVGGDTYIYTKSGVTFTAGKFYDITVNMAIGYNLAMVTSDVTVPNGYTLTGTLGGNYKISVPNDATVTLDGVTIERENISNYWAGITCEGNATIILKDGSNNTVIGNTYYPGIQAAKNNTGAGNEYTLTIKGSGSLNVSGYIYPNNNPSGAGIGGGNGIDCGNIVIENGTITATGGSSAAGIGAGQNGTCGNISISQGNVTAKGGTNAAGIGGGYDASCGSITISGGTIDAEGGEWGAGIGCGQADNKSASCNNISISGGTITAKGGNGAAGIGSGEFSHNRPICGDISISGGTVTATGGDQAAGIGSGDNGACGNISISQGTVTATGGDQAAGIGGGIFAICGNITINKTVTKVTATKGDKHNSFTDPYSIGIGSDDADHNISSSACVCGSTIFDNDLYKFTLQWNHDGVNPNSWTYSPEPASGTYGGLKLTISGKTWTLEPTN